MLVPLRLRSLHSSINVLKANGVGGPDAGLCRVYLGGLLLTLVAFFAAVFYLGTPEAHAQLMRDHFWITLALRLGAGLLVGFGGLVCWAVICLALLKLRLLTEWKLERQLARVALGPLVGAIVGAIIFCLP